MNIEEIVYRPPYEADSLLLQVTHGCSHNKCTFCYMYPEVPFSVYPMEQVETDLEEASQYCPDVERVFLENGDAFVGNKIEVKSLVFSFYNGFFPCDGLAARISAFHFFHTIMVVMAVRHKNQICCKVIIGTCIGINVDHFTFRSNNPYARLSHI